MWLKYEGVIYKSVIQFFKENQIGFEQASTGENMLTSLTISNLISQLYKWENFLPIQNCFNFLKYVKDLASSELSLSNKNLYCRWHSMALQMTILIKRIQIL